jgi:hypothetical protein
MKILLTEKQFSLIEATGGLDSFVNRITEKFFNDDIEGDYKEFQELLKTSIEKSGCEQIDFGVFKYPAGGVVYLTNVVINEKLLKLSMGTLIYAIFHEIGHQYQLRKYGDDNIYQIYSGEIELPEAIQIIRKLETVADEYGLRKVREFIQRGFVKPDDLPKAVYKNVTDNQMGSIINDMKKVVSSFENKTKESIVLNLYNFIVSKIT